MWPQVISNKFNYLRAYSRIPTALPAQSPAQLSIFSVDESSMSQFDQEMKLFEEIKSKYKPTPGFHLVLDLDAYKQGEEIIQKFEFDSDEYLNLINIEHYDKNTEIVIITSNLGNSLHYISKALRIRYDYDKALLIEFEDYAPNPFKIKRTLKQQVELLVYDLNNPKPAKKIC